MIKRKYGMALVCKTLLVVRITTTIFPTPVVLPCTTPHFVLPPIIHVNDALSVSLFCLISLIHVHSPTLTPTLTLVLSLAVTLALLALTLTLTQALRRNR